MKKDDYFYIEQSEMSNFFKMPYALIKDEKFKGISLHAKILYGLLLDRMSLSRENHWVDAENRVYIIYRIKEIMKILRVSKRKAIDLLKELEEFSLVEKKRQGVKQPNLLYVKDFTMFVTETSGSVESGTSKENDAEESDKDEVEISFEKSSETKEDKRKSSGSVKNDASGGTGNYTSRGADYILPEVLKLTPNNHIEVSQTELSHTESNHILSGDANDKIGITACEIKSLVQRNLEADRLISEHPEDIELIEGIVDLITETLMINKPQIKVAKRLQEAEFVKKRLLCLKASHIKYVMECLEKNAKNVGNMKQYLLTALFNAPLTMEASNKVKGSHKDVAAYKKRPANRFVNYPQPNRDFDELERLERELRDRDIANYKRLEEQHAAL